MPIARIARFLFDRVRNRMAEVQDAPKAALSLVLAYDIRLDRTGARDHMHRHCGFECEHVCAVLLEPHKEVYIIDDAVLDDLTEPRPNLAAGQRPQKIQIHKDGIGLIECADEILAERVVDSHLAADTRIHLCEETCRELDERNTAHIGGRDEARKIADYAAAECNDRRTSV